MKGFGIQLIDNNDQGEVMDIKIDPKHDAQGKIVSGFVVGSTLQQNQALILLAHLGDLKFRPDMGVGIEDLLLSDDFLEFRHRVREHLTKDGLKVNTLELYPNKPVVIESEYERS